jgi:hypothetical protein
MNARLAIIVNQDMTWRLAHQARTTIDLVQQMYLIVLSVRLGISARELEARAMPLVLVVTTVRQVRLIPNSALEEHIA